MPAYGLALTAAHRHRHTHGLADEPHRHGLTIDRHCGTEQPSFYRFPDVEARCLQHAEHHHTADGRGGCHGRRHQQHHGVAHRAVQDPHASTVRWAERQEAAAGGGGSLARARLPPRRDARLLGALLGGLVWWCASGLLLIHCRSRRIAHRSLLPEKRRPMLASTADSHTQRRSSADECTRPCLPIRICPCGV